MCVCACARARALPLQDCEAIIASLSHPNRDMLVSGCTPAPRCVSWQRELCARLSLRWSPDCVLCVYVSCVPSYGSSICWRTCRPMKQKTACRPETSVNESWQCIPSPVLCWACTPAVDADPAADDASIPCSFPHAPAIVVGPNLFTPNEVANPMESLMVSQKAVLLLSLTIANRACRKCGE